MSMSSRWNFNRDIERDNRTLALARAEKRAAIDRALKVPIRFFLIDRDRVVAMLLPIIPQKVEEILRDLLPRMDLPPGAWICAVPERCICPEIWIRKD